MDDEQPPFVQSTGFLLARLGSTAYRLWADALETHALTPHQHAVLLTVAQRGQITATDLTRALQIDPRNLTSVIDRLDDAGLVTRVSDPTDRRRRIVELTQDGAARADALTHSTRTAEDDLLAPLSVEDRKVLNALLRRLYAPLTSTRP